MGDRMPVDKAIIAQNLTKRFRRNVAVDGISFDVPVGCVCGFVGPNGSGKTTTIRMLLDLLRPNAGDIRVVGLDPKRNSLRVRRLVGYVPETHHIYDWLKVSQVLKFTAAAYPTWDWEECRRVNEILELPRARKVKQLSRGEMAKLALTIALSHKPALLILDEPTSGLDPLVRRNFLEAIVHLLKESERSVFFSTHILSDVERVADRLIILNKGRIVADDTLECLRSRFTKASFLFEVAPDPGRQIPKARRVEKGVREWVAVFDRKDGAEVESIAAEMGATDHVVHPMTLEDVFVELVGDGREGDQ